jgi:hypothetical protein
MFEGHLDGTGVVAGRTPGVLHFKNKEELIKTHDFFLCFTGIGAQVIWGDHVGTATAIGRVPGSGCFRGHGDWSSTK